MRQLSVTICLVGLAFSMGLLAACAVPAPTAAPPLSTPTSLAAPGSSEPPGNPPTPSAIPLSPTSSVASTTASNAPTLPSTALTPSTTATPDTTTTSSSGQTITVADNGKTIPLNVGDLATLALDAGYVWQVQIDDPSVLAYTPSPPPGGGKGSLRALAPGHATLNGIGTPACYNAVPRCLMPSRAFQVQFVVQAGPPSSLSVTLADNGKTIHLSSGQEFLLDLGDSFNWTVTIDDQSVASRVVNVTTIRGAQGVYRASKPGQTTLRASGIINCPRGQVCPSLAQAFQVQLNVQ